MILAMWEQLHAKEQGNTDFPICMEPSTGPKPGEHVPQVIDVPFPAAALKAHRLRGIHLHLTCLFNPSTALTINEPVSVGKQESRSGEGSGPSPRPPASRRG